MSSEIAGLEAEIKNYKLQVRQGLLLAVRIVFTNTSNLA